MTAIAERRLGEERKNWRKDHPPGFVAKPILRADKSTDLLHWEFRIPGYTYSFNVHHSKNY